jgi:hypothetical protein
MIDVGAVVGPGPQQFAAAAHEAGPRLTTPGRDSKLPRRFLHIAVPHIAAGNLVPLGQSEGLAEALKKANVDVKLQIVTDDGHGGPGFSSPENRKLIEDFFDTHLRPQKNASRP